MGADLCTLVVQGYLGRFVSALVRHVMEKRWTVDALVAQWTPAQSQTSYLGSQDQTSLNFHQKVNAGAARFACLRQSHHIAEELRPQASRAPLQTDLRP